MENNEIQPTGAGNFEAWSLTISKKLPEAWNLITRTVDPLLYAGLIELLGSNNRFSKKESVVAPILDDTFNIASLQVKLVYSVPDFANFQGSQEAVMHDQQYLLQKVQQVGTIAWSLNNIIMDTNEGMVTAIFNVPLGV